MLEEDENMKTVSSYEIDDKKYMVISNYKVNEHSIDKLYEILCKYIISQLN